MKNQTKQQYNTTEYSKAVSVKKGQKMKSTNDTGMFDNEKLNDQYNKNFYFIILDPYFNSFALNIPVNINI